VRRAGRDGDFGRSGREVRPYERTATALRHAKGVPIRKRAHYGKEIETDHSWNALPPDRMAMQDDAGWLCLAYAQSKHFIHQARTLVETLTRFVGADYLRGKREPASFAYRLPKDR
jgi:hypothetical protein